MNGRFAHPSSWSNRTLRDAAAETGRQRWQTSDQDLALRIEAAVQAVAEAMSHLSPAAIMDPPHAWFDAALARQMVVHILVNELEVPRRLVASVSLMSRAAVATAIRTIEARSADETFVVAMTWMQARASQLYRKGRLHG